MLKLVFMRFKVRVTQTVTLNLMSARILQLFLDSFGVFLLKSLKPKRFLSVFLHFYGNEILKVASVQLNKIIML